MSDESDQSDKKSPSLAAMPGILVIITLAYLSVMHLGTLQPWPNDLEGHYLEASAEQVRGPVSLLRARLGLEANNVVQREGELYFLPDIKHLTGRSFLRESSKNSHVVLRRGGREERSTDPVSAILHFDQSLRSRGIRLVLLPTPSKAMFAGPGEEPLRNEGFAEFLEEMKTRDVAVFDLAPHFADYAERGHDLFLETDSHWTPQAMRMSAVLLSAFLKQEGLLPGRDEEQIPGTTLQVTNAGDLAKLLESGPGKARRETIMIHPLREQGGEGWEPDQNSPLLLLGDSFTNVFSLPEMGWGEDAGFAEALSQTLGFSIDCIARNADGAFSSRQELSSRAGRLEAKTVVVWQFAARELSLGDWKALSLPEIDAAPGDPAFGQDAVEIEGTIARVAKVPPLTRTPYRQAVMEVHLVEVKSAEGAGEFPQQVVLHGLGVRNREPTAMTKWRPGEKLKVKVVPWRQVEERYGRLHRFALDDPELELIDAVRAWVVE